MRPLIAAPVAAFSLFAIALFSAPLAHSQINGTPASVTSPGFGGRAINGTPASVTSLGPHGFAPAPRATFTTVPGGMHHGNGMHHGDGQHHHNNQFVAPLYYGYPVAYPVEVPVTDDQADSEPAYDPEYQGGPTIFDRRGSGADSYIPPVKSAPAPRAERLEEQTTAADPPDPPLPPTILVFKDGHKLEVGNYAIVGTTLFDLTPGHARRVAVVDLDVDATRKENDDRGIVFQLPQTQQGS